MDWFWSSWNFIHLYFHTFSPLPFFAWCWKVFPVWSHFKITNPSISQWLLVIYSSYKDRARWRTTINRHSWSDLVAFPHHREFSRVLVMPWGIGSACGIIMQGLWFQILHVSQQKTPLVRKATENYFIKSTFFDKTQSSVYGFCWARSRVCNATLLGTLLRPRTSPKIQNTLSPVFMIGTFLCGFCAFPDYSSHNFEIASFLSFFSFS